MNSYRAIYDKTGKGNGSVFIVKHQHNWLKFRCSKQTEYFADVIELAARQLGYDPDVVFLSDKPEGGCIYLKEQRVFDVIFPLVTAQRVHFQPSLYVVLKRNMTSMDIVDNEQSLKDEAKKLVRQEEHDIAAKNKLEYEAEIKRIAEEEHELVMEKYRKKRRYKIFFNGMINFLLTIVIFLIFMYSSSTMLKNVESL